MKSLRSWAQDVIACDLCAKPTQLYCNTCQVNLCEECANKHKEKIHDPSHNIVPFIDKKIKLTFLSCQIHPCEKCKDHCITCDQPVCKKCISYGTHAGHDVINAEKFIKDKKKRIETDVDRIKSIILKYQNIADDCVGRISDVKSKFADLEQDVEMQRQLWHEEVDSMFDKLGFLMQYLKNKKFYALAKQQVDMLTMLSDMRDEVEESKQILHSCNLSTVSAYQLKFKEYREPPEIVVDITCLKTLSNLASESVMDLNLKGFKAMLKKVSKRVMGNINLFSTRTLVDEAKEIASIHTEQKPLFRVALVGNNEAWVSGITNTIARVDLQGSKFATFKSTCQEWPADIATSQQCELIYTDNEKGTVYIVRDGAIESLITTPRDWNPNSIFCSRFGDIVVNISFMKSNKIVFYNGKYITQEIDRDELGFPIFKEGNYSLRMTENNNGDICVSDSNANIVVVLDRVGGVRFRYDGTPATRKNRFGPKDVVTDSLSQIIVSDYNNDSLHILDQNGRLLRCIDNCALCKPCGLSVDSVGRLWVVLCHSGKIKVLEYLTNM
uniref:Uncharacterized protein LOC111106729 isoform X1 n=1 Tax=Crassostrea virginica TaxID=6565 RepID=A0A8B8B1E0_CRAVI|nr:uncharacterized protein LOC111106729 isoform X1 [Crassostrea virginica]